MLPQCCEIYAGMRGQRSVPSRSQRHVKGFIVWHLLAVAALSLLAGFKATLAFRVLSKSEQLPRGIFISLQSFPGRLINAY